MPTPRDSSDNLSLQVHHTSCPPDGIERAELWREETLDRMRHAEDESSQEAILNSAPEADNITSGNAEKEPATASSQIEQCAAQSSDSLSISAPPSHVALSPQVSAVQNGVTDKALSVSDRQSPAELAGPAARGLERSRVLESHSSCRLRAGSRYTGTQTSEQSQYAVEVNIKTVDMSESYICGYLRIEGLTPEHASLTTFFEGEIIGPRYAFQTRHSSWGATEKDDMKYWAHFSAWKPLAKQARKGDFLYERGENRDNIFMRWKEKFLVPNYTVREISGASFEGFYYICFNQISGRIQGIYYHSRNDQTTHGNKVQDLKLNWVNDRGCSAGMEFR